MNKKLKNLFKDTSIYGLGNVIKKIVGLLLVPFYTRALSPEQYGILNTLGVLVSMMVLIGNFGMIGATKRYFFKAEEDEQEKVISTALIISITITLFLSLIGMPFSKQISLLFFDTSKHALLVVATLVLVFVNVLMTYNNVIFRLYRKAKKYLVVMSFNAIIKPSAGILLVVVLGMGVLGAQLALIIAAVLVLFFSYFFFTRTKLKWSFDKVWAKKMFIYGVPFIGAGLAQWIYTSSDRIFLAHYAEYQDVGYYSIAGTFAQPIQLINMALAMSLGVLIMSNYENEKDENKPETKNFLIQTWKLYILAASFLALFLSIFATEILEFVTTPEYIMGALGIPFHSFALLFYQSGQTTGGGMAIKEKTKPYMYVMFITAGVNIILNFILIPKFGFVGALSATMLSQLMYLIIIFNLSQSYFKVDYPGFKITLFLIIIFIISAFFPFAQIKYHMEISIWYKIIVAFGSLGLPFIFGLVKFSNVSQLYNEFLKHIKPK